MTTTTIYHRHQPKQLQLCELPRQLRRASTACSGFISVTLWSDGVKGTLWHRSNVMGLEWRFGVQKLPVFRGWTIAVDVKNTVRSFHFPNYIFRVRAHFWKWGWMWDPHALNMKRLTNDGWCRWWTDVDWSKPWPEWIKCIYIELDWFYNHSHVYFADHIGQGVNRSEVHIYS